LGFTVTEADINKTLQNRLQGLKAPAKSSLGALKSETSMGYHHFREFSL
jgi:hypothetical protein